jgi:predicted RNA-binding protein YlxR (DUF448 family)/ribosomal protein L30E
MLTVSTSTRERAHPERTCVGCRRVAARGELVRLCVLAGPPHVAPDLSGKLGGRGAWVCARRACVRAAVRKGGLSRAAGRQVSGVDADALARAIVDQLHRRMTGLLSSAVRTRRVAMGTDATKLALESGGAKLLVVAEDASGRREELEAAAGRLGYGYVIFGTKASLGSFFDRAEVGVLAVLDAGIAAELAGAAERAAALLEDG